MDPFYGRCGFVTSCVRPLHEILLHTCRLIFFCDSEQCQGQFYCMECPDTAFCNHCESCGVANAEA
jgi:hypothetical protein